MGDRSGRMISALAAEIPAHYLPTAIVFLQSSPIRSGCGSTVTALDFHRENLGLCPAGTSVTSDEITPVLQNVPLCSSLC